MARLVVLLLLLASFANIVVADNTSQKGYLDIKESSFNFGKFPKKQVRACVFIFKNTGSVPVVIENASTPCNCTSVKFPRQPIMPGKKAYISVYYNGKNYAAGHFRKSVDIHSTASNSVIRLFISGVTE